MKLRELTLAYEIDKSWVNALFAPGGFTSNGLFASPLVADGAGFTYQYQDLGLCHS